MDLSGSWQFKIHYWAPKTPPLICISLNNRSASYVTPPGGGGVLPYITYTGIAAQWGRDFEAPGLERVSISETFSRTGYNISKAWKLQFCKQPFEIIQGQIAFKNTVQCVNKQTVILLLHPRTEYKKLAHF